MITKIDKDGNAFGSPSIIVIKSDGKVKTVGGGTVTDVTATSPLSSTGGTTPNISIPQATSLQDGFLRSGDWTFFNSKQDALVSGTNIKTVNGNTLLGSGDLTISASSSITVGTTPITSGVDGRVLFQSGGVVSQDSGFFWDNTNKRLGVGTSTPSYALHVSGITRINNLLVTDTDTGVSAGEVRLKTFVTGANHVTLKSNGDTRFGKNISVPDLSGIEFNNSTNRIGTNSSTAQLKFDSFGYMVFNNANTYSTGYYDFQIQSVSRLRINTNGNVSIGATTAGARLDVRAQGALSTDIAFRVRNSADTLDLLSVNGLGVLTAAADAVVNGVNIGRGGGGISTNTRVGLAALNANTTGAESVAVGWSSLVSSQNGSRNVGIGFVSLGLINGSSDNIAIGHRAGRYFGGGTSNNLTLTQSSIFMGSNASPLADNQTNQIVIGHNATGLGSNTVVLGNTSIVTTQLRGTVRLSLQAAAPTGVEGAIYYDSTTKKHYGHDGTAWNALY